MVPVPSRTTQQGRIPESVFICRIPPIQSTVGGSHGLISYLDGVDVRFYVDPNSREPHCHRHGVTEAEVVQAMGARSEDRPGREGSRLAFGRTENGRYLRVIYVPEEEGESIFVVTAYELAGKSLWAFGRRRRRKR